MEIQRFSVVVTLLLPRRIRRRRDRRDSDFRWPRSNATEDSVQFIRGVPFSPISQTHLSRAFLVNASREQLGFKDRNLNGFLSREKIKKEEVRSCLFDEDRFKKRQSVSKKGKETFVRLDILFFTMHYNFTFIRITPTALLNVLYDEIYFVI